MREEVRHKGVGFQPARETRRFLPRETLVPPPRMRVRIVSSATSFSRRPKDGIFTEVYAVSFVCGPRGSQGVCQRM